MNKFYWKLARAKTINYTIPFFSRVYMNVVHAYSHKHLQMHPNALQFIVLCVQPFQLHHFINKKKQQQ